MDIREQTTHRDTRVQIDTIIARRKEKAKQLEKEKESLQMLLAHLKKLHAMSGAAYSIKDTSIRETYTSSLASLHLMDVIKKVEEAIASVDTVIRRFNREYLSIATVGKERQGKSKFLQSVSSLDDSVIPAYEAGSCTGAVSVIRHDPSMPKKTVKAVISYRKKQDLVDIVNSYIKLIIPTYENVDFDQIKYLDVEMFKRASKEAGTEIAIAQNALKYLKSILDHFDKIAGLFDQPDDTLTDKGVIKTIVAQNNGIGKGKEGHEPYHKYLAVAKVDITCCFNIDPGKIRLIDTVGIESAQYGVVDAMLSTVKNDCDAAIVVTKPEANPQVKDQEVYTQIMRVLKGQAPEKWIFYLTNHYVGRNDAIVQSFDDDVAEWNTAGHMIVDCSDPYAVNKQFMPMLLDTILRNLEEIDQAYVAGFETAKAALIEAEKPLLSALGKMGDWDARSVTGQQVLEKGRECFNAMALRLRDIVHEWSSRKGHPNELLWGSIRRILDEIETLNPGGEAIQNIANSNPILPMDVWYTVLNYIRNEITRRFIEIDDALYTENIRFKNSLVKVLFENLHALFGGITTEEDDTTDRALLLRKLMEEKGIADNPQYEQIYKAIVFLDNFQFNTRAAIIQIVRSQLCIINPLCDEYANPNLNAKLDKCGIEIDYYLTSRLSLIEENLRHMLRGIYSTPNEAFFACAEEFYDRLIFAATDISSGKIVNMSDIWGHFFQQYSAVIWKEQAEDLDKMTALREAIKSLDMLIIRSRDDANGNGGSK